MFVGDAAGRRTQYGQAAFDDELPEPLRARFIGDRLQRNDAVWRYKGQCFRQRSKTFLRNAKQLDATRSQLLQPFRQRPFGKVEAVFKAALFGGSQTLRAGLGCENLSGPRKTIDLRHQVTGYALAQDHDVLAQARRRDAHRGQGFLCRGEKDSGLVTQVFRKDRALNNACLGVRADGTAAGYKRSFGQSRSGSNFAHKPCLDFVWQRTAGRTTGKGRYGGTVTEQREMCLDKDFIRSQLLVQLRFSVLAPTCFGDDHFLYTHGPLHSSFVSEFRSLTRWGAFCERSEKAVSMDVVTGAFGFIGRYIARALLEAGHGVRTVTTHPGKPNPFGAQVEAFPYDFETPRKLTGHLVGCERLFNTYWVRFNYGGCSFDQAVKHTETLLACAKEAGIQKVVHISVTNPSENDSLPYYAGKARQEQLVKESGLPWCIIRPTLVFGKEDILLNNMAWLARTFPVVPIFGKGDYRIQPVYVGDLASIAVDCAAKVKGEVVDAIGPENYTYRELLQLIVSTLGRRRLLMNIPPVLGILLGRIIGLGLRDVLLTRDELRGLMANKLTSNRKPNGTTLLSKWLAENRDAVGRAYTSELKRHFRWKG